MPYKDPDVERAYRRAYFQKNRTKILAYLRVWKRKQRQTHPDKVRAAWRMYSARNKDKESARNKQYRQTHPDKIRGQQRRYSQKHAVALAAKTRAWYVTHKEQSRTTRRAYAIAHPEVDRAAKRRKRAHKRNAPVNNLTHAQWLTIQEAQGHRCAYCGKRCKGHLTQDHLTPLSKGGSHTLHNVIGACRACNARKHTGPPLHPVQPLLL